MSAPTAAGVTATTAPTRTVTAANGVTYAYRRFGNTVRGVPPVLFLQHFRGNLDNWDPALVDPVAAQREVVLVDYAGVGGSSGVPQRTVAALVHDVLAFVDALGPATIDVHGFSLGGFVAQELALVRPKQVRRLVLSGTAPEGGPGIHGLAPAVHEAMTKDDLDGEDVVFLFFETTPASVAAGWAFVQRYFARTEDRDAPVQLRVRDAQLDAITAWGVPDPSRSARLAALRQPALVANGDHDIVLPTDNTRLLGELLPNARVSIYPNAGHGFLFQYPAEYAAEINAHLG
ncbi:alpha/beta hydrolase [Pseudonocardia sp. CNS-139]|nr:alpha/beta hydrolase [Pseudonocardia sp. CNS-139]